MNFREKIAFGGFASVAFALTGAGTIYLLADRIMPYHLAAMESSWENLPNGIQVMSLNFMKSAGAGMITVGIGMMFLLMIPFRKGKAWSRWALLWMSLAEVLMILSFTRDVITKTAGGPSLTPLIAMAVVSVISFLLSVRVENK